MVKKKNADPVYAVHLKALENQKLPKIVRRVLELFDSHRSIESIFEEVHISPHKGKAIIKKLQTMGLLEEIHRDNEMTGFSSAEEQFFATELTPIDECDLPFETIGSKMRGFISKLWRWLAFFLLS